MTLEKYLPGEGCGAAFTAISDMMRDFDVGQSYADRGLPFGIGEMGWMDAALLYAPERTEMLFTPQGHCVGWGFDGKLQLHPLYRDAEIIKNKETI